MVINQYTNEAMDLDYVASVCDKAVKWAYDGSRGSLRVTSGFGCWRALARGVATFLGVSYEFAEMVMTEIAYAQYGKYWYAILWAENDYSRIDAPHRDANGVHFYLMHAQKAGLI